MKGLVELIDLVDENGDVKRKFFGISDFEQKIEKPVIQHYTFDFDFVQKFDDEIKYEIIDSLGKYENFDLIKDNIKRAEIYIFPSETAERVVKKYKSDLRVPLCGVIDKLILTYKGMGFGK